MDERTQPTSQPYVRTFHASRLKIKLSLVQGAVHEEVEDGRVLFNGRGSLISINYNNNCRWRSA